MFLFKLIKNIFNSFNNDSTNIKQPQKWSSIATKEDIEFEESNIDLVNITIFFKNNIIINVIPDVYNYYKARYYNIDGVKYDTKNISAVKSIPLKKSDLVSGTPVYNLEYLLRKRAREERKLENNELAYALLKKSNALMKCTSMKYNISDYLLIVKWLFEDGLFEEAEKSIATLHNAFPAVFDETLQRKQYIRDVLLNCKKTNTDYVYCSPHGACCNICSMQQARVYCISGKDKRFPQLPNNVYTYGGFHKGCRCTFSSYYGIDNYIYDIYGKKHNAISYSNRPYKDERTAQDKEQHKALREKPILNSQYYENLYRQKGYDKLEYRKILEILPQYAPKSFSGYMRMKKNRTKNFMKLYELAKENNISISL